MTETEFLPQIPEHPFIHAHANIWPKLKLKEDGTYVKESMLRILGASGISMNREFEKKVRRLRASKLAGTSIADSLTVSKR